MIWMTNNKRMKDQNGNEFVSVFDVFLVVFESARTGVDRTRNNHFDQEEEEKEDDDNKNDDDDDDDERRKSGV